MTKQNYAIDSAGFLALLAAAGAVNADSKPVAEGTTETYSANGKDTNIKLLNYDDVAKIACIEIDGYEVALKAGDTLGNGVFGSVDELFSYGGTGVANITVDSIGEKPVKGLEFMVNELGKDTNVAGVNFKVNGANNLLQTSRPELNGTEYGANIGDTLTEGNIHFIANMVYTNGEFHRIRYGVIDNTPVDLSQGYANINEPKNLIVGDDTLNLNVRGYDNFKIPPEILIEIDGLYYVASENDTIFPVNNKPAVIVSELDTINGKVYTQGIENPKSLTVGADDFQLTKENPTYSTSKGLVELLEISKDSATGLPVGRISVDGEEVAFGSEGFSRDAKSADILQTFYNGDNYLVAGKTKVQTAITPVSKKNMPYTMINGVVNTNKAQDIEFTVYNLNGQVVDKVSQRINGKGMFMPSKNLASGNYILQATGEQGKSIVGKYQVK